LRPLIVVSLVMSLPVMASNDWLASKYGSLKSTAAARSGRIETWAAWKSNAFGPGANAFSKVVFSSQLTWSRLKPSFSATAYAVAPSRPSPLYGLLICQKVASAGWPSYMVSGSPPHHGGKAGLSVLSVSRPAFLSAGLSGPQAIGSGLGLGDGDGGAPAPQAASTTDSDAAPSSRRSAIKKILLLAFEARRIAEPSGGRPRQ
jgi:hypothetical protein